MHDLCDPWLGNLVLQLVVSELHIYCFFHRWTLSLWFILHIGGAVGRWQWLQQWWWCSKFIVIFLLYSFCLFSENMKVYTGSKPGHRLTMTQWLKERLTLGDVPGLYWIKKGEMFGIQWLHASHRDYDAEHSLLFRKWAEYNGMYLLYVWVQQWVPQKTMGILQLFN